MRSERGHVSGFVPLIILLIFIGGGNMRCNWVEQVETRLTCLEQPGHEVCVELSNDSE